MEPYILIFIINLCLSYVANICYDKKYKLVSILSISILVLVNVIFSGCRDFGVGIDTNVYIEPYFNAAADLQSLKSSWSVEGFDKGFLLLAYVSSLFSDDAQSLLVVTSLFIQVFFYLALWQYKKVCNINLFVATLLFCIIFYCHTLNLMRQFCSISLLAFAFSLFIQGKWKIYIALQIFAFFFHSTSIIFLFVPIFMKMSKMENIKKRNIYSFILLISLFLFVFFYFTALTMLGDFNIVSETYTERYGQNSEYMNKGGYGFMNIFNLLYPIAFVLYAQLKKVADKRILYFILMLSIIVSIFQLLSFQIHFMDRLPFYMSFIMFIYLSKIFSSAKMSMVVKVIVILLYMFNWHSVYIVHYGGDIYPYKSKILNVK